MAYNQSMTEDEIVDEVKWLLHYDITKNGVSSRTCHYTFWGLLIEKLLEERNDLERKVDNLQRQLDGYEV